ncbi:MAG: AAA family ATPase [Flavobacteriia bacterium]
MYPKQLYQAQSIYNRNKDNFRDIKIAIYDDLLVDDNLENLDHLFNILIIKDIAFISKKLGVDISYDSNHPEFFYVLGFIAYLVGANHLIGGLQGNDIDTKIRITDYFDKMKEIELPSGFIIKALESKSNTFLNKSYKEFITQFSQGIVAADQNVTTSEMSAITDIISQISSNSFGEIAEEKSVLKTKESNTTNSASVEADNSLSEENIEDVLAELESFTGMDGIKKDVRSLINLLKIQKQRENQGLSVVKPSLHMVFTGPPGTGKTTVARIMGRVFKALGVLENGHIIETDRSGLVAGYVGQTAIKVDEIVQKSLNGILFIDEAYTLSPSDGQDSFGQEAIDTLLKRMEDNRDSLVVIVAGYEEEMQRFIESNPGFKSRFNKYISFDDYKPEELKEIFLSIVKKNKYKASDELVQKIHSRFSELYNSRTKSFGNGRVVRNLFEKIVENQSNRLASVETALTEDDLQTLLAEDFPG